MTKEDLLLHINSLTEDEKSYIRDKMARVADEQCDESSVAVSVKDGGPYALISINNHYSSELVITYESHSWPITVEEIK